MISFCENELNAIKNELNALSNSIKGDELIKLLLH